MKLNKHLDEYRIASGPYASNIGDTCGAFLVPYKSNTITVMAYDGEQDGWEHVSVSLKNRNPNWDEMSYIKSLFWDKEDTVAQFHVPESQHITNHPYCLHMWKEVGKQFDLPDSGTVGKKELNNKYSPDMDFPEFVKTLNNMELVVLLNEMKNCGEREEIIKLVQDELKKRK